MKQPKLKVTDLQGNEVGLYKVEAISWDNSGNVRYVSINSIFKTEFYTFFDDMNGEFIERTHGLKGQLIYE